MRPCRVDTALIVSLCVVVVVVVVVNPRCMQIVMELKAKLQALETGPQQSPTAASPSAGTHGLSRFSLLHGPADGGGAAAHSSGRAGAGAGFISSPLNMRMNGVHGALVCGVSDVGTLHLTCCT